MKNATIRTDDGTELCIEGRIRKHRFSGIDPRHCDKCGREFASVTHK